MFGEAEVALRSDSFLGNGAEHGGAVVMRGNLTVQVEDCLFKNNVANNFGGGVTLTVRGAAFGWVGGCSAACRASLVVVVVVVLLLLLLVGDDGRGGFGFVWYQVLVVLLMTHAAFVGGVGVLVLNATPEY